MTQINRAKIKGVKKQVAVNDLCYLYYLVTKSALRSRRECKAKAKAKRTRWEQ
jgi:hypothetical protein